MALTPQPVPPSFEPPAGGSIPHSGFWLGVAAAALAVAAAVSAICREIAARWRGIVVAHLFFLTLWMAVQVFFFTTGAHWCLPSNGTGFVFWLTKSFGQVARCGPAPPFSAAFGSTTVAATTAPALTPAPVPSRPSSAVPAATRPPSTGTLAAPAANGQQPASGTAAGWSAKTIVNCWRNRAIDSGDCYETADPRRRPPPAAPRYRYPAYVERPSPPPYPCRRPYDCRPEAFWGDDL